MIARPQPPSMASHLERAAWALSRSGSADDVLARAYGVDAGKMLRVMRDQLPCNGRVIGYRWPDVYAVLLSYPGWHKRTDT